MCERVLNRVEVGLKLYRGRLSVDKLDPKLWSTRCGSMSIREKLIIW